MLARLPRAGAALLRRLAEDVHVGLARAWPHTADVAGVPAAAGASDAALDRMRREADAALRDLVLPFWAAHGCDEAHGGFVLAVDADGRTTGAIDKHLVPQARMVWTFAAAHRHGIDRDGRYADLARRGARFLVDRMWDARHGGFVTAVARDGAALHPDKRTYGQAFAIYALAELALATGDAWARGWAERAVDVLVERAEDGALGFFERFDREWRPIAGPAGQGKTVNVHLHLVEALTPLVALTRSPAHAARLRALVALVLERGVDARWRCTIDDLLTRDWTWRPGWRRPVVVSYGHAAELAWLARLAIDVLGDPAEDIRGIVLGLVDHALRYGFDPVGGGIATFGPPIGAARRAWYLPRSSRAKRWWEQAEMLVALLMADEWTGDPRYRVPLLRQFAWVRPAGPRFDPRTWGSHDWGDPYHGVRALIEVSRRLAPAMLSA